jgi:hypothetical protein
MDFKNGFLTNRFLKMDFKKWIFLNRLVLPACHCKIDGMGVIGLLFADLLFNS